MRAESPLHCCDQCIVVRPGAVEFVIDAAEARVETSLNSISGPHTAGVERWVFDQVPGRTVHVGVIARGARVAANDYQIGRMRSNISETGCHVRRKLALQRAGPRPCKWHAQVLLNCAHRDVRADNAATGIKRSPHERRIGKPKWIVVLRSKAEDWRRSGSVVKEGRNRGPRCIISQKVLFVAQRWQVAE